MKEIFFDFDGVIEDTFEFHRKKIIKFTNIELSVEEYRAVHMQNFFFNIPEKFKHIDWREYAKFVRDDFVALKIKPDIKEKILEFAKKHNLYINTSNSSQSILEYLTNNGLVDIFKEVLGFEFLKSKSEKFIYIFNKYKFISKEGLFITDTLGDIAEANKVKLKTVAVDFGYHKREILEKECPLKVVSSFEELAMLIKKYD